MEISRLVLLKAMTQLSHGKCPNTKGMDACYTGYTFELCDVKLYLKTTNGDISMRRELEIYNVHFDDEKDRDRTLSWIMCGSELKKALNLIDDANITLTFYNMQFSVGYSQGSFMLPLCEAFGPKIDYKDEEEAKLSLTFEVPSLKKWLNNVAFCCACDEDLRPAMCGVLLDIKKDGVDIVGTSGHILARMASHNIKSDIDEERRIILPRKAVNAITKVAGKVGWVDIYLYEHEYKNIKGEASVKQTIRIDIESDNDDYITTIMCNPTDARYPDYSKVIPTSGFFDVYANTFELLQSVRRMGLFTGVSECLVFRIREDANQLQIGGKVVDYNICGNETITARYEGSMYRETSSPWGLKHSLLEKVLTHIKTKDVVLRLTTPGGDNDPILVQGVTNDVEIDNDAMYLIMPMLVNE